MLLDGFILLGVFLFLFIMVTVFAWVAVPHCRRCRVRVVDTGKRYCDGCADDVRAGRWMG